MSYVAGGVWLIVAIVVVLRKPCPGFRTADIFKFAEHLNAGKCERCLAFFRQLEKEQLMQFLRESRN